MNFKDSQKAKRFFMKNINDGWLDGLTWGSQFLARGCILTLP